MALKDIMATNPDLGRLDPAEHSARIQAALNRIFSSEMFEKAERLRSFLTYVVEETVAGRAKGILGKTIAQDVYLGNAGNARDRRNLVRVDAGRLRQKLAYYYDTVGDEDDTRIHIDTGSYVPWFEDRSGQAVALGSEQPRDSVPQNGLTTLKVFAAATVGLATLFFYLLFQAADPREGISVPSVRNLKREALATRSPAAIQALNYCNKARGLLFPIARIDNQKLASAIFQQAQKSDPNYFCGYAGLGHSLATSALFTSPGESREEYAQQAVAMAHRAVELAPTDGWTQSAVAWSSYAAGDAEKALQHSKLAESLAPTDGNVLDFRGLIQLVLGQFSQAYETTDPERPRMTGSYRFAHRNLHAVASFHLGKYSEAIASLNFASQNGDPVSPLSLVFLAASYQGLKKHGEAKVRLDQLRQSWPDFSPKIALSAFYSHSGLFEDILLMLREAGWVEPIRN